MNFNPTYLDIRFQESCQDKNTQSSDSMDLLRLVFGLVYSAAVIFEEVKEGTLAKEELEELHLP